MTGMELVAGDVIVGVDVGGTFTDVVAVRGGAIETVKVPTNVVQTELGVLQGAKEIGVERARLFNHASTHGLNAVITRRLPKIGFLTTDGHRDILDMGRTWRPVEGLNDPGWRRSFGDADRPLVPRYLRRGVRERMTATGDVLIPLEVEHAREQLRVLKKCGVQGVAICLINAYAHPEHEQRLRELVHEELSDVAVSISSEASPLAKEYARASTTVVDVLMKLIYHDYTSRLESGLHDLDFTGDLNFADCAAQLIPADAAMKAPFRIVFAGPAAGTMSSAHFGASIDVRNIVCCDVGGTSADISLVADGSPFVNTTFELEHDLIVNALSNEISSIGAGGGSLVTVSPQGEIRVGPGSAGSSPGPACYGAGGTEPTLTDACVVAGILGSGGFAGGHLSLDAGLAEQAFEGLPTSLSLTERVRQAFWVAAHNVAEGITNVAVRHGIDPRDFSLMAFGAAGPMLLPATLDLVGAKEVIVPPHPGLFSALGLTSTDLVYTENKSAYMLLAPDSTPQIDAIFKKMAGSLRDQLEGREAVITRSFDGRLLGQSWETPFVDLPDGDINADAVDVMISNFHKVYAERSGRAFEALPVQGVTFRVQAQVAIEKVEHAPLSQRDGGSPPSNPTEFRHVLGESQAGAEYPRADLRAADVIAGPAVIREPMSTTFILPGQKATVGEYGELRITKSI